jgi:DNA ligase (NAD+)
VAGLANRNKPNPQISKVKVMAHEILKGKGSNLAPSEQYKELKRLGFTPVPYKVYDRIDGDMLTRLLATRKKKARREIDGLVVALDKPYKRVNGNPDHMFAFKVNDKENSVVVTVKEVEWNQSRYGKLPPRVIIPPTTIGGVTVTYATGHNAFFIDHGYKSTEKNPPYSPRPINKGAKVRILRSGDVIPQIIEVVKASPTPSTPDVAHKRKGVNYYAVDKSDDKTVRAYTFFFSTLKIDGIKSGTIVDLMNRGFMHLEDIVYAEMEDFRDVGLTAATASKLARNIKAGIENADVATLAVASGVFGSGIGDSKLRPIFEAKPNAYMLKEPAIHKLLESMPGYKTTIPQICAGMIKYRKWLKDMGIKPMPPKKAEVTGNKMKGKNVLFTSVRDEELKKWIIANGGKVVSSVGQANLLIVKNMDASNKKTDYANANGIPIITVADFREEMM